MKYSQSNDDEKNADGDANILPNLCIEHSQMLDLYLPSVSDRHHLENVGTKISLDLSQVSEIDSYGVQWLLIASSSKHRLELINLSDYLISYCNDNGLRRLFDSQ